MLIEQTKADKDVYHLKKTSSAILNFQNIPETYNLKGIRSLISPSLLHALASAGWEDDIAIVDSTFPADSLSDDKPNTAKVIHLDGVPMVPLVREIMKLWQLDKKDPIAVMVNDEDKVDNTPVLSFCLHVLRFPLLQVLWFISYWRLNKDLAIL